MGLNWNKSSYGALMLSLGLLASCQKESPVVEQKTQHTGEDALLSLSLDASADWEDVENQTDGFALADTTGGEARAALNIHVAPNGSSRTPKMKLGYTAGDKVNATVIIKNKKTGTTIIKPLDWTFGADKNGRKTLSIRSKKGQQRGDGNFDEAQKFDLKASPKDWYLFVVLGGHYNQDEKTISFNGAQKINPREGRVRGISFASNRSYEMEPVYMTKGGWTPLELITDKKGNYGFRAKSTVVLSNAGTFFALQPKNERGPRFVEQVRFSVDNYSFAGTFNLANATVGSALPFEPNVGSTEVVLQVSKPGSERSGDRLRLPGRQAITDAAFFVWGIPTVSSEESTVGGLYKAADQDIKKTAFSRPVVAKKRLDTNKVYPVQISVWEPEGRQHPIEQFYTDASGTIVAYPRSNPQVNAAVREANSSVVVESTGLWNTYNYNVAEMEEYKIIAPALRGNGTKSDQPFVTLDGKNRESHNDIRNYIKAFGAKEEFREDIRNNGYSTFAIRFKGGAGNKYYSAYLYERQTGRVKITVRHLGPKNTHIGINQVANSTWWEQPAPRDVRQIVRYVPFGVYMSSTRVDQNRPNVRSILSVSNENEIAKKIREKTETVYTSEHTTWGLLQGLPKNQKYGSLIIAEEKK